MSSSARARPAGERARLVCERKLFSCRVRRCSRLRPAIEHVWQSRPRWRRGADSGGDTIFFNLSFSLKPHHVDASAFWRSILSPGIAA